MSREWQCISRDNHLETVQSKNKFWQMYVLSVVSWAIYEKELFEVNHVPEVVTR